MLLYNPSVAAGMRCHLVGRDPTLLASPAADEIVEDVLEGAGGLAKLLFNTWYQTPSPAAREG